MTFRFVAAVALVVAVSLCGVALERGTLDLRREVSRQHFRREVLQEENARLRSRTQELGAPARLLERIDDGRLTVEGRSEEGDPPEIRTPLLFWRGDDERGRSPASPKKPGY